MSKSSKPKKCKNSSPWVLYPSESNPGSYYYFNVSNGESIWSFNDIEKKYTKRDNIQKTSDNSHYNFQPKTPPCSFPTSTVDQDITPSKYEVPNTSTQRQPPTFGQATFPKYIPTMESCASNIIWMKVPCVPVEVKPPMLDQVTQTTGLPTFAQTSDMPIGQCMNYKPPNSNFDANHKTTHNSMFDRIVTSTPMKTHSGFRIHDNNDIMFGTDLKTNYDQYNFRSCTCDCALTPNKQLYENHNRRVKIQKNIIREPVLLCKDFRKITSSDINEKSSLKQCAKVDSTGISAQYGNDSNIDAAANVELSPNIRNDLTQDDLRHVLLAKRRKSIDISDGASSTKRPKTKDGTGTPKKKVTFDLDSTVDEDEETITAGASMTHNMPVEDYTTNDLCTNTPTDFNETPRVDAWYIVADTEVLLDDPEFIDQLVLSDKKCKLLVPAAVRADIEALSVGEWSGQQRVIVARQLTRRFMSPPQHYIVTPTYSSDVDYMSSVDDILDCCIDVYNSNYYVVLISNNPHLHIKSKSYNIPCYKLQDLKANVSNTPDSSFNCENMKLVIPNDTSTGKNYPHNENKSIFDLDTLDSDMNSLLDLNLEPSGSNNFTAANDVLTFSNVNGITNTVNSSTLQRNENEMCKKHLRTEFKAVANIDGTIQNTIDKTEHSLNLPTFGTKNQNRTFQSSNIDGSVLNVGFKYSIGNNNQNEKSHKRNIDGTVTKVGLADSPSKLSTACVKNQNEKSQTFNVAKREQNLKLPTSDRTQSYCRSDIDKVIPKTDVGKTDHNFKLPTFSNENPNEKKVHTSKSEDSPTNVGKIDQKFKLPTANITIQGYRKFNIIKDIDLELQMFNVSNKIIISKIENRINEWICNFTQIMEDGLNDALQNAEIVIKNKLSPPWTLHEAITCIKLLYGDQIYIKTLTEKYSDILTSCSTAKGTLKTKMAPNDFTKILGLGLILIRHMKSVLPEQTQLNETESLLWGLWEVIRHPSEVAIPLEAPPIAIRSEVDEGTDTTRFNFLKEKSYVLNYLKRHYKEWKSYDPAEDTNSRNLPPEMKVLRTSGKNLKLLKIGSNKSMTLLKGNDIKSRLRSSKLKQTQQSTKDTVNTTAGPKLIENIAEPKMIRTFQNYTGNKGIEKIDTDFPENGNTFSRNENAGPKVIRKLDLIARLSKDAMDLDQLDYSEIQSMTDVSRNDEMIEKECQMNVDTDQLKDDCTIDSGFENDSTMAYSTVKVFLTELSGSFKAIKQFVDDFTKEMRKSLDEDRKNTLLDKASRSLVVLDEIIQELNCIIRRESNDDTKLSVVLLNAGSEAASDKRIARYRQVIMKCLEQALFFRNAMKIIISIFEGETDAQSVLTANTNRYINIFE